jgi:hypothetical protein
MAVSLETRPRSVARRSGETGSATDRQQTGRHVIGSRDRPPVEAGGQNDGHDVRSGRVIEAWPPSHDRWTSFFTSRRTLLKLP